MKRWMLALGIGAALTIGIPVGMSSSDTAEAAKPRNKLCMYKSPITGAASKWKCKADETCCWSVLENKGSCKAKGLACLL